MIILETERLLLESVRDDDFEDFFRLQSDPEVMRFIRKPETDRSVVRGRMEEWARYTAANPGLGVWALRDKASGAFAGYCVLRHVLFTPGRDLEVGYTVAPEFSGRGLATELTQALARYAFERFAPPRLVAFTDPNHVRSQRVLEKSGFVYAGTQSVYAEVDAFFVLEP
jgi:ribosomal-protein-alanine N-acetyltransferase